MSLYIAFEINNSHTVFDITVLNEHGIVIEQLNTPASAQRRDNNDEIIGIGFEELPPKIKKLMDMSSKVFVLNDTFNDNLMITFRTYDTTNKLVFVQPSSYYKTLLCTTDDVSYETIMKTFHFSLNKCENNSERTALLFYHTQQSLRCRRYGYRAVDSLMNGILIGIDFCKHYGSQLLVFGKQQVENCRNSNTCTSSDKTD